MNTNAKPTPGPWRAEIEEYPFRREIYIETQDFDPDAGEGERIARVFDETDNGRANARLIEKAPDMFSAIQDIISSAQANDANSLAEAINHAERVIAAISQAEGGAQ